MYCIFQFKKSYVWLRIMHMEFFLWQLFKRLVLEWQQQISAFQVFLRLGGQGKKQNYFHHSDRYETETFQTSSEES